MGPGSFTGLRVGLATAKGLCLAGGIPLVAVPTLDALARMVDEREQSRSVHAIIDARRGEVYWASYEFVKGEQRKTGGYLALSPAQLTERLIGDTVLVGSGVDRYKDYIRNNVRCQVRFIDPNPRFPTPMLISILGLEKLRAGDVVEIDSAEPIYIRPSDAETRRGFE
jgi:tRNA threonylcarbamoyladenosine biosynthesis protein TsaB